MGLWTNRYLSLVLLASSAKVVRIRPGVAGMVIIVQDAHQKRDVGVNLATFAHYQRALCYHVPMVLNAPLEPYLLTPARRDTSARQESRPNVHQAFIAPLAQWSRESVMYTLLVHLAAGQRTPQWRP